MNFANDSGENTDLEYYWETINMDDIATPGSFWLNPPLPKDDEGNGVSTPSIIESYGKTEREKEQQQKGKLIPATTNGDTFNSNDPDDDNSHLEAILMDIDPL